MANERYFFYGAAVTAVIMASLYFAYRSRKQARLPMSRIAKGERVSMAELVAIYRTKPNQMVLSKECIATLSEKIKTLKKEVSQKILKGLLDECVVAERQFAAIEKKRQTEFEEDLHKAMLEELWTIAFGPKAKFERLSDKWGRLGFQGVDPKTDLRGGGILALEQMLYFAKHHQDTFTAMIKFNDRQGDLGMNHWFLTAVVSIQFTVQLATLEHPTYLQHLEVLYSGQQGQKMAKKDDDSLATKDQEVDGFNELHAALMKHFFECWQKDLPHVMNYTQWVPKVYDSFFSPQFPLSK